MVTGDINRRVLLHFPYRWIAHLPISLCQIPYCYWTRNKYLDDPAGVDLGMTPNNFSNARKRPQSYGLFFWIEKPPFYEFVNLIRTNMYEILDI
jgi:hypothetical protein